MQNKLQTLYVFKKSALLSKPVLLYYAFEKLANILMLVTFKEPYSELEHGLSYHKGQPIRIYRKGLFQIFHDCYSDNLSIYLEEHNFKLESIIDAGEINYVRLQDLLIKTLLMQIRHMTKQIRKFKSMNWIGNYALRFDLGKHF